MALTPEQALAHLDEVAQKFSGTRQDHVVLQASVQTLAAALTELQTLRSLELPDVEHTSPALVNKRGK